MPTWNFGGHIKGAELMLSSPAIGRRFLISKNVCHGVLYTKTFLEPYLFTPPNSTPNMLFQQRPAFMPDSLN